MWLSTRILKIFLIHKHFPPPNGRMIKNAGAFLQTWDDDPSSPAISWGLGFRFGDSEKLNEIAGELQARKVGRGNIAQLRNQENTMVKALESEPWILLRSGNHWESSYSYLSFCGGPWKNNGVPSAVIMTNIDYWMILGGHFRAFPFDHFHIYMYTYTWRPSFCYSRLAHGTSRVKPTCRTRPDKWEPSQPPRQSQGSWVLDSNPMPTTAAGKVDIAVFVPHDLQSKMQHALESFLMCSVGLCLAGGLDKGPLWQMAWWQGAPRARGFPCLRTFGWTSCWKRKTFRTHLLSRRCRRSMGQIHLTYLLCLRNEDKRCIWVRLSRWNEGSLISPTSSRRYAAACRPPA